MSCIFQQADHFSSLINWGEKFDNASKECEIKDDDGKEKELPLRERRKLSLLSLEFYMRTDTMNIKKFLETRSVKNYPNID